jgi:UDP-2,3-diacylglucosamine pyrophosphatase LpxH
MSVQTAFTETLHTVESLTIDETSRLALFSDCHRGDNSWTDDYARNEAITLHALRKYYDAGFTYIELGDGDELLENNTIDQVIQAHPHTFALLGRFNDAGRLFFMTGNHNPPWKYAGAKTIDAGQVPESVSFQLHDGLLLKHKASGGQIFLIHGHQGDLMTDTLWRLIEFMVLHIWTPLQRLGILDPMSPAQNFRIRKRTERKIVRWIQAQQIPTICGHTHRSTLPIPGDPPYFNTGCCIYPRGTTNIEIVNDKIALVMWRIMPNSDGELQVQREVTAGPYPLRAYFEV